MGRNFFGTYAVPVMKAFVFPKYNTRTSTDNFGLLYLARKAVLRNTQRISLIKLPDVKLLTSLSLTRNFSSTILGWGQNSFGLKLPQRFKEGGNVSADRVCPHRSSEDEMFHLVGLEKSWCFVAGTQGMPSIDRGSPLVVKRNRTWVIIGVYSRGETRRSYKLATLFSRIDASVLAWMTKLFAVGDKPQCKPSGHKVLDTPARAQSNKVNLSAPLCDNNLKEDWYKIEINGFPAIIPTNCPAIGSCGTQAQIWIMSMEKLRFGEDRNGSACVAWNGPLERICCMWKWPIRVTHCGDFVVYWLKGVEDCSMAYCAQQVERAPCRFGKMDDMSLCNDEVHGGTGEHKKKKEQVSHPTLTRPPNVTPMIPPGESEAVHLICAYSVMSQGFTDIGYQVTWYKLLHFLGGKTGKLVLQTIRTNETSTVINSRSADFRLGDTITCEVSLFHWEIPKNTSNAVPSEYFYVGVKVQPSYIDISEDQTIREFIISLTVPLVCPMVYPNCTIKIPIYLKPAGDRSRVISTQDIVLSTCEVTLKPQPCTRHDCGSEIVSVMAVSDFIDDGDRMTMILTKPAVSRSSLWKSYDPPDAIVQSKDIRTPRCYLFAQSYIKTIYDRFYQIQSEVSTFVLYKSTWSNLEVHTRFWRCNKSAKPSFCACGVAATDGDDVVAMDMCHGRFLETSVQISVKSGLPLSKGMRITEAVSGKRYTVHFPSGVSVQADVFEWGLNVRLQATGSHHNHLTGICGMSDENDFSFEGLPAKRNDTERWRLRDSESLFSYKPRNKHRPYQNEFFCACKEHSTKKRRKCSNCESQCRRRQYIFWSSVTRERDLTKKVQYWKTLESEKHVNVSNSWYSYDVNHLDVENRFFQGNSDTLLTALSVNSRCRRLLTNSPLARSCAPVIGQHVQNQLVKICFRDMMYTGVSSMVWGVAALLQNLCEDVVFTNTSSWEPSGGKLRPSKKITRKFCPRFCSDHGKCVKGTCKCRRGRTGEDCSVFTRRPPQLISVFNDGKCDLRTLPCKQVIVVGSAFNNSRDLRCSVSRIKRASFVRQTFLAKATYGSYREVTCDMPVSHDFTVAENGYYIRVSNDGRLWSQPLPFVVFDGLCLACSSRGRQCEIKVGTCHIDGRCRKSGESNPQDLCKWCSPDDSQNRWTDRDCQSGTCADNTTCVHGECQGTKNGRYLCLCDDGFIGSRCDVIVNLCNPNPCGERGTCVQLESTFHCICLPGFTGPRCFEATNPCASISCKNGSCAINGTDARCSCDDGFTGEYCETSIQEVLSANEDFFSPPENCLCPKSFIVKLDELTHRNERHGKDLGGTRDLDGLIPDTSLSDVRILCYINSTVTSGNCSIDLSLQKNENGDCYGNFVDICYIGLICGTCNKSVNSTEQGNSGSLNLVSFHLQRNLSFNQTCYYFEISLSGIEDDQGKKCRRISSIKENITLIQNHNCSIEGRLDLCLLEAVKGVLGYVDYSSLYKLCNESIESAVSRGNESTFFKDSDNCTCLTSSCHQIHYIHGRCKFCAEGKVLCEWERGFKEQTCNVTINDLCQCHKCIHGECTDLEGSFRCECHEGFEGKYCDKQAALSPCEANLCINGQCLNRDVQTADRHSSLVLCLCNDGYTGEFCQTRINSCTNNPCKHGLCIDSDSNFHCFCDEGYTGMFCDVDIDPCSKNPCQNGSCTAINTTRFQCNCFKGFQGKTCNATINHCTSSPCKNDSTCISRNNSFMCSQNEENTKKSSVEVIGGQCEKNPCIHGICRTRESSFKCYCYRGYSGEFCQRRVNPCEPNPCEHGFCLHRHTSWFDCRCELGYTGRFCHKDIDMCQSNPCKYGTCVKLRMSFQCQCAPGFYGRHCDKNISSCHSRPCKRGVCVTTADSFVCECPSIFTGRFCEKIIDPCKSTRCKYGFCVPNKDSFRCACYYGYTGRNCHVPMDPCFSKPCARGDCIATANSFTCVCPHAYTGPFCESKIDACKSNPCLNGTCTSTNHSFRCICDNGFSGELCEVAIDPCAANRCRNGKCSSQGFRYFCTCYKGFSGRHCESDIDECLDSPCFDGVQCLNYVGTFRCGSCPEGFTGNGSVCHKGVPFDPCQEITCFPGVSCEQRGDTYGCGNCPERFTGDGINCTVINPTERNSCSPNPCYPMVQCSTVKGSQLGYRCGPCPDGYTGSGVKCTPLCPVPCPYGMRCIGHQTCRCPEGYRGVGCKSPICRDGCYNGGRCVKPDECKCKEGYEGLSCLSPICWPPCRNGGKCVAPSTCRCSHGFMGSRCQVKRCLVTCLNGGSCIGLHVCKCLPEFSGRRCEIAPCSPRCQNGGLCLLGNMCKCPAEYVGDQCQFPLCRLPCFNGGKCVRPNVCMCSADWRGNQCQRPVCHLPCLNGGRCARPNHCTCTSGYSGIMCEKAVCSPPCLNGGQCVRPGACACPFGFTGRQCELKDSWEKRLH
ncbi:uncharacterized protein LOC141886438 isoform X2 [Acropora palmata]|uniref:uncharacterized protein LOC141886438 isoform X2 n=1 Tax=Acropora palmata TaxID=6131 RepID=UPI003DA1A82B